MSENLPIRSCMGCGGKDDHPRDVVTLPDGSTAYWHHDCHALIDPPCTSCSWLVAHKGELIGQDWRDQIDAVHIALPDEQFAVDPRDRDVVTALVDGKAAV